MTLVPLGVPESRDCRAPGCVEAAEPGRLWCDFHLRFSPGTQPPCVVAGCSSPRVAGFRREHPRFGLCAVHGNERVPFDEVVVCRVRGCEQPARVSDLVLKGDPTRRLCERHAAAYRERVGAEKSRQMRGARSRERVTVGQDDEEPASAMAVVLREEAAAAAGWGVSEIEASRATERLEMENQALSRLMTAKFGIGGTGLEALVDAVGEESARDPEPELVALARKVELMGRQLTQAGDEYRAAIERMVQLLGEARLRAGA